LINKKRVIGDFIINTLYKVKLDFNFIKSQEKYLLSENKCHGKLFKVKNN
tara:strand:- start:882 stop:1031 length:150 start_codon:yes stop_codon:yes gene_type:complete